LYSFRTKISDKNCFYCQAPLYKLGDGRVKCSYCKSRYSPQKLQREIDLIELFCRDFTALKASKELKVNYITAKKAFDKFRKKLALFLEDEYEQNRQNLLEYDEYLYLDSVKRGDKRYIFDGFDFLTFDYGGRVYNILMPSLQKYKKSLLDDELEDIYYREFSKFLTIYRVAKISSHENTIVKFWRFFDSFFRKYKGIKRENFFYYLKEAEFKFNYPKIEERIKILKEVLYF